MKMSPLGGGYGSNCRHDGDINDERDLSQPTLQPTGTRIGRCQCAIINNRADVALNFLNAFGG